MSGTDLGKCGSIQLFLLHFGYTIKTPGSAFKWNFKKGDFTGAQRVEKGVLG